MTLDPFYPIVDSAAWLERLLPVGIRMVQMRIKDRPRDEIRREIRAGLALCRAHHCLLIVNDYWQIAIDEKCDFVHLGQEDLEEADVGAIRRAGLRLGLSTHDHNELERALGLDPDYVALGPIYPTILKAMKWAPQGLARIGEWKGLIGARPLVAIGGLSIERAAGVYAAGADCISVVTDITRHDNPEARTNDWILASQPYRGAFS